MSSRDNSGSKHKRGHKKDAEEDDKEEESRRTAESSRRPRKSEDENRRLRNLLKIEGKDRLSFKDAYWIASQTAMRLYHPEPVPKELKFVVLSQSRMLYRSETGQLDFEQALLSAHPASLELTTDSGKSIYIEQRDCPPELLPKSLEKRKDERSENEYDSPRAIPAVEKAVVYVWGKQILRVLLKICGQYGEEDEVANQLATVKEQLAGTEEEPLAKLLRKIIVSDPEDRPTFSEIRDRLRTSSTSRSAKRLKAKSIVSELRDSAAAREDRYKKTIKLMSQRLEALSESVERTQQKFVRLADIFRNKDAELRDEKERTNVLSRENAELRQRVDGKRENVVALVPAAQQKNFVSMRCPARHTAAVNPPAPAPASTLFKDMMSEWAAVAKTKTAADTVIRRERKDSPKPATEERVVQKIPEELEPEQEEEEEEKAHMGPNSYFDLLCSQCFSLPGDDLQFPFCRMFFGSILHCLLSL